MPIFIKSGLHLLHNGPVLLRVKFDGGIRGAAGDIILAIAAAQKTSAVVETLISYFLHLFPAVKTKNPEHGLGDGAPVFAVH